MSALLWALRHPANQRHRLWTFAVYARQQVAKRIGGNKPATVDIAGQRLSGQRSHPVICLARYVRAGLYDLEAFLVYAALLEGGSHFLDVGANIGAHTLVAAGLVGPTGRVVAVEPDPGSAAWLARNLGSNDVPGSLVTQPLADGARRLAFTAQGETTSQLAVEAPGSSVLTTTVDQLVRQHGLDPGRLVVKVDVEGWEAAVIVGADATLEAGCLAFWVEANGLQARCDVPWGLAVEAARERGYGFWWPDLKARRLRPAPEAHHVSPIGDYLIATRAVAQRVERAVADWPGLARARLGLEWGARGASSPS